MAEYRFEVKYSEAQLRKAARAAFIQILHSLLDWRFGLVMGIVTVCFGYLLLQQSQGWLPGGLAGALLVCVLMFVAQYRRYLLDSLERFQRMRNPVVSYIVNDEEFTAHSDLGRTSVPWSSFTGTARVPGYLMLVKGHYPLVVLPAEGVEPKAIAFIQTRIAAAQGAKGSFRE